MPMTGERYVLLGLAQARAPWFADLSRWSTSGALPAEFVKALSVEEVTARLRSGRPFSALIVDASVGGCDRDLIETATAQGCAVVVIDREPSRRRWADLGAAALLPADFGREALADALRTVAQPVARADDLADGVPPLGFSGPATPSPWRGRLVAVTGAGGTGRSTLAMALAVGLGADPRDRGSVLLADLALNAHQGLLHDCGDVVPGLSELVDAYRRTALPVAEVRRLCFAGGSRGYDLLLGLRRQRDWTALRPHAVAAALDGLRSAYRIVVADVDADVEGEAESGSIDIEERNQLARASIASADLVAAVGVSGIAGLYSHIRLLGDLARLGVPPDRVLAIVNRAPRSPRRRAEISTALSRLLGEMLPGTTLAANPIFVPERRRIEDFIADGGPLPSALVEPITGAVRAMLERVGTPHPLAGAHIPNHGIEPPVAVAPGSLGSWTESSGEHTG
jgi:hypothetical protein